MTQTTQQISSEWLAKAGLRPTRQRMTLAHLLVGDGQHRHVTAESLFEAAARTSEKVSLATVYNTLRAFCDAGLLREITVGCKACNRFECPRSVIRPLIRWCEGYLVCNTFYWCR